MRGPHRRAGRPGARAVRASGLLDTLPEEAFDRYARLARRVLRSDEAQINVVDADRQFTKACVAADNRPAVLPAGTSLPVERTFCARLVAAGEPVAARDVREHPLFDGVEGPGPDLLPGSIGAPLRAPSGEVIGTLGALTTTPHGWAADDLSSLTELRDSVETEIALRAALAEASRRTRELEERSQGIETLHAALGAAGEDWASASRAAAHAAHELRTPLVAMRDLAEALGAEAPAALREDVRTMQRTAGEALRLVIEQLALARRGVDRPPTRVEDVDVGELLVALRGMTEPLRGHNPSSCSRTRATRASCARTACAWRRCCATCRPTPCGCSSAGRCG